MIPTAEQKELIKTQLQDILKVRETYEEIYDHIITALEAMPDNKSFNEAMDYIFKRELGAKVVSALCSVGP
ncbi:hypothetical protein [Mucilaginibacter antarcticus]|uniref:hypothetical protein n=1 Tax=Mucilaginibacter antarcticus TaxID=1855725 RepID=UPI00362533E8